jgi:EAL domain-containing protein (putative c-di-GMP-specific phosphodiesterase class I)
MGLKRIRWEFDDIREIRQKSHNQDSDGRYNDLSRINDLILNDAFTAHFQPIFQAKGGSVLGYEA